MVILDTDHMTDWQREMGERGQRLERRLGDVPASERATTVIAFEEQTRGRLAKVASARKMSAVLTAYRNLSRHLDLYRPLLVLPFDQAAAVEFERLKAARVRVGTMDLRIAAVVLIHDALLLTRNTAEFRRVPGLKFEDWTR